MPYAATASVASAWSTGRAIGAWAFVAGDLAEDVLAGAQPGFAAARRDGARIVLVQPDGVAARNDEVGVADVCVSGPLDPAPRGLFEALTAAGLADVRLLGVVGGSPAVLEAAARVGAGAIVGLAGPGAATDRGTLLHAQPDAIVEPGELAALDYERYGTERRTREYVLLNPGPAVVTDRIHRAVAGPDLCHREPEYTELFGRVQGKLRWAAGVDASWSVVLLGGSGTAAMEAMTGAFVRPDRRLLVCRNGTYGARLATIASRLGIEVVEVATTDTTPIDPSAVEDVLRSDPLVDAVAVVHHETTTGLLNPVHEIAAVARTHGALTIVDAISSLGAEELRLGDGIDVVAGTSNKCLHGLPGVAFLLMSPAARERAFAVPPRSLYFDVPNYLRAQDRSTVPFTPPIPAIYGLEAALDELADEGRDERRRHYRERMAYLDTALTRLGLEPRVTAPQRSSSVRSLPLPAGIAYDDLHDAVKRDGYVIYAGLGEAARTSFRVCALGALDVDALQGFVASLERAISTLTPGLTATHPSRSRP